MTEQQEKKKKKRRNITYLVCKLERHSLEHVVHGNGGAHRLLELIIAGKGKERERVYV
jgi:hypothetical protein